MPEDINLMSWFFVVNQTHMAQPVYHKTLNK